MPIEFDFEAEHWRRFLDTAGLNLASTDSRITNAKKNLSFFCLQYLSLWVLLLLVTTGPVLLSFFIAQSAIWLFAYTADSMEVKFLNVELRGWARRVAMSVQFILLCRVSMFCGVTRLHACIFVGLTLLALAHAAFKLPPPKPARGRGRRAAEVSDSEESD